MTVQFNCNHEGDIRVTSVKSFYVDPEYKKITLNVNEDYTIDSGLLKNPHLKNASCKPFVKVFYKVTDIWAY